ncbi:MAG: DUF3237 family protein [Candidatus Adiutricales bacterium]
MNCGQNLSSRQISSARFETSSEKYNWLTRIVCVGVGAFEPGGVRYKIYEIL